jgi:predicted amidohydrolase
MPNKKYKIAVIQLNLNDVAKNKNVWVGCVMPQIKAEVITLPELYSSHYFCQSEDVDNFGRAALQHLVYRFQCFSQRTRRSNHCSFFEKEWLVFITIVPTL